MFFINNKFIICGFCISICTSSLASNNPSTVNEYIEKVTTTVNLDNFFSNFSKDTSKYAELSNARPEFKQCFMTSFTPINYKNFANDKITRYANSTSQSQLEDEINLLNDPLLSPTFEEISISAKYVGKGQVPSLSDKKKLKTLQKVMNGSDSTKMKDKFMILATDEKYKSLRENLNLNLLMTSSLKNDDLISNFFNSSLNSCKNITLQKVMK